MGCDVEWTDTELPHLEWRGVEFCGAELTACHIGIHTSRLTAKPEESKSPTRVNRKGMCQDTSVSPRDSRSEEIGKPDQSYRRDGVRLKTTPCIFEISSRKSR